MITNMNVIIVLLLALIMYPLNQKIDIIPDFEVKLSPYLNYKSRGLFAKKDYNVGDIIEHCPTIQPNKKNNKNSIVNDYSFFNIRNINKMVVPFGYCNLINHSKNKQNCTWVISRDGSVLTTFAIKPIKKGEEIFTNYGNNYWKNRNMKEV